VARTRSKSSRRTVKKEARPSIPGGTVRVWEDDPGSGVLVERTTPNPAKRPLAYSFPRPMPKPAIYQPGTREFRFWTAAEALRRGADFWAARIPLTKWEVGQTLRVLLDEGVDLNAYYDRRALNFFHGSAPGGTAYSGESPDIVCHEMGHAILDSFKPQLWGAASHEVAAFHESFGDMSSILSALQLPSLRTAILSDTGGHLYRSSRLSRLAEQLGAAIRAQQPDAVDPDCLRNAVNSFTYQDPINLPPMAPARQLSSEPHSFSRVFTGALLAGLLVGAVKQAPVVPNWYAQVAAGMVQAAGSVNTKYPAVIKGVFVKRSILSLHSASTVEAVPRAMTAAAIAEQDEPLVSVTLSAQHYGLDRPLMVEAASHARRFVATAAAGDAKPIDPVSSVTAARSFVDDLFRSGHVDYGEFGSPETRIAHGRRLQTHHLVAEGGAIRLQRRLFDCDLCGGVDKGGSNTCTQPQVAAHARRIRSTGAGKA